MGITKGKGIVLACVAAIIIVVVIALVKGEDNDEPKVDSGPKGPISVFPERGYTEAIVKDSNGQISCDLKSVASVMLADNGGTVANNGLLITSKWDKDSVLITFNGTAPFISGYVVGSKSTEPFNIPKEAKTAEEQDSPPLLVSTKDFSKAGVLQDVVLCGGGM